MYDLYINGNLYQSNLDSVPQALNVCKGIGDWVDEVEILKDNETPSVGLSKFGNLTWHESCCYKV